MSIAELIEAVTDGDVPMRVEAYDGSSVGPLNSGVTLRLLSSRGLRYLITAPGDLGLARAYVAGDLELHGAHPGDPYSAMQTLASWDFRRPKVADVAGIMKQIGLMGVVPPAPPDQETLPPLRRALEGMRHSRRRDAVAIERHYDVSNDFYERVLGPTMAYTCAVFDDVGHNLEHAQAAKLDLIARKLDLHPGTRLLDVGCGWGSMAIHAAKHYGAHVVGITLSEAQAAWASEAVRREGLEATVRIVHGDYRDAPGQHYDAVSSIGLLEHIGVKNYSSYFQFLRSKLRAGGRLLNHCITRPDNRQSTRPGAFIDRYVFPDAELAGVGTIAVQAQDAGLEVRHVENLREHYALTLKAWCANLVSEWDACVAEVGIGTGRVWGLYMAGSRIGFETNAVQLHQLLAVRVGDQGNAEYPLRPAW